VIRWPLSAYYHDSAAVLIRDGEIIAAAQEERFSRERQGVGHRISRRRSPDITKPNTVF